MVRDACSIEELKPALTTVVLVLMLYYLFWTTGVFVWPWGDPCRSMKGVVVLSTTTVTGSCGQMSAHSADIGQQSGEKGDQVSRASRRVEVEMGVKRL